MEPTREELDAAWSSPSEPAAAEVDAQVAAVEVATPSDEAAAPTEEVAAEAVETEAPIEDAPEDTGEVAAESDGTADDDFQDLLDDIPTADAINKKFERVPKDARAEMVKYADEWRANRDALNEIGGKDGLEVLKPIVNVIQSPDAHADHIRDAWATMLKTNKESAYRMIVTGGAEVLFNKGTTPIAQEMASYGDELLSARFGEGVSAEHIENLLLLEKGGLINVAEDMEVLQLEGKDSSLFQKMQEANEELKAQIEQLKNGSTQPAAPNYSAEFDTELSAKVADEIKGITERIGWKQDSPAYEFVMKALLSELKNDPEYRDVTAFLAQSPFKDASGKIPFPIATKLGTLTRKAQARFTAAASAINSQFRTQSTRNTVIKEQVKETKPQPVAVKPQSVWSQVRPFGSELDAIYAEGRNS